MKFYEFNNDHWINLAQIVQVKIAKALTIRFSDGTDLIESDRNVADRFLEAMKAYELDLDEA